jgi:hypothetical protein
MELSFVSRNLISFGPNPNSSFSSIVHATSSGVGERPRDLPEAWEEFIKQMAAKINIRVARDLAPFI